jgi:hypothetical protein
VSGRTGGPSPSVSCVPWLGAAGGLLQPLATKALVDRLASGETIAGIVLALTALVVLSTVVEALGAFVLERTAESVVLAARRSLIGRLCGCGSRSGSGSRGLSPC